MLDKDFNRKSIYSQCYKRFRKISNPIYGECELLKLDNSNLSKLNISPEKKSNLENSKLILLKRKLINDLEEAKTDIEILKKRSMIHHENLIEMLDYEIEEKSDFCSTFYTLKVYYKFYLTNLKEQIQLRTDDNHHFTEKELVGFLYDTLDVLAYLQGHGVPHGDIRPELLFFEEVDGKTVTKLGERMSEHDSMGECQLNHLLNNSKIYMSPNLYYDLSRGKRLCEHNVYKSDLFSLGLVFLEMGNLLSVQDIFNEKIGEISKDKLDTHYERFYSRYENSPLLCSAVKTMIEMTEKKRSNGKRLYKRLPDMEEIKQYYEEIEKIKHEIPSVDTLDERTKIVSKEQHIRSEVITVPKSPSGFNNRQTFEPDPELQKIYHQNQVKMQNAGDSETKLDQYYFDEEEYRKNFGSVQKYSEYDEFHKETMKKLEEERIEEEEKLKNFHYEKPIRNRTVVKRVLMEPQVSLSPYRKMKQREEAVQYNINNPFDTNEDDKENVNSYNPNNSNQQKKVSSWKYKKDIETQPKTQKVYEYATFNANPHTMSTVTEKSINIMKNLESGNSMISNNSKKFKKPLINLLNFNNDEEVTGGYESTDEVSDQSDNLKNKINLFETNKSEFISGSPEIKAMKSIVEKVKLGSPIPISEKYASDNSHQKSPRYINYEEERSNSAYSNKKSIQRLNTIKNLRNENSRIMSMKTVTKDNPQAKLYEDSINVTQATPSRAKLSYVRQDSNISYTRSQTPKPVRTYIYPTSPMNRETMKHYSPQPKTQTQVYDQNNFIEMANYNTNGSDRKSRTTISHYRVNNPGDYSSNKTIKVLTPNRSNRVSHIENKSFCNNKSQSKSPSKRTISPNFTRNLTGNGEIDYSQGRVVRRIVHRIDGTHEVIEDGMPYIPSHQIGQKSEQNLKSPYKNYDHVKKNLRNYTPVKLETFINQSEKYIKQSPIRRATPNTKTFYRREPSQENPQYSKSPLRTYQKNPSISPIREYKPIEEKQFIPENYTIPEGARVIRVNGKATTEYKRINYIPEEPGVAPSNKIQKSRDINSTNLISTSTDEYNPYYRPFGGDNTEDETAYEFENPYT